MFFDLFLESYAKPSGKKPRTTGAGVGIKSLATLSQQYEASKSPGVAQKKLRFENMNVEPYLNEDEEEYEDERDVSHDEGASMLALNKKIMNLNLKIMRHISYRNDRMQEKLEDVFEMMKGLEEKMKDTQNSVKESQTRIKTVLPGNAPLTCELKAVMEGLYPCAPVVSESQNAEQFMKPLWMSDYSNDVFTSRDINGYANDPLQIVDFDMFDITSNNALTDPLESDLGMDVETVKTSSTGGCQPNSDLEKSFSGSTSSVFEPSFDFGCEKARTKLSEMIKKNRGRTKKVANVGRSVTNKTTIDEDRASPCVVASFQNTPNPLVLSNGGLLGPVSMTSFTKNWNAVHVERAKDCVDVPSISNAPAYHKPITAPPPTVSVSTTTTKISKSATNDASFVSANVHGPSKIYHPVPKSKTSNETSSKYAFGKTTTTTTTNIMTSQTSKNGTVTTTPRSLPPPTQHVVPSFQIRSQQPQQQTMTQNHHNQNAHFPRIYSSPPPPTKTVVPNIVNNDGLDLSNIQLLSNEDLRKLENSIEGTSVRARVNQSRGFQGRF